MNDGRNINPQLGTLSGEGSHQRVEAGGSHLPAMQPVLSRSVPSQLPDADDPTYYGHPLLKTPVWEGIIALYFYVGGASGAAMTLGAVAQAVNRRKYRQMVQRTRWIAMGGSLVSAALLIYDLGRPERFLYMLRVLRLSSPMSVGTWILSSFGMCAGAAAMSLVGPQALHPYGNAAGYAGGVLGLGLAGYTAVLLAQTAVPVWQVPAKILPVLFLGSATASAASVLDLMPLNQSEEQAVRIFGVAGKTAELAAMFAVERAVAPVERIGRPLHEGFSGLLWQSAKWLGAASLLLSLLPGTGRKKRMATGVLGTAASLSLRYGIYYAGKANTGDARASFHQQRQGF